MREQELPTPVDIPPEAIIVGAGPAGLMAAETLARAGVKVAIHDQMAAPARKFLLAGRGGLNLTHSEDFDRFLCRYGARASPLRGALEAFPPQALRSWCEALGEPTFIGTSGRVFPLSLKATPLLRSWLKRLAEFGVTLHVRERWTGWNAAGDFLFETPDGPIARRTDLAILALGGASWPRLGSNGHWTRPIAAAGIGLAAFRPANCGFDIAWSQHFSERFEGVPIKGAAFSFDGRALRGEAVITKNGIEGGAIYALSADIRDALLRQDKAVIHVALRPDLSTQEIVARLLHSTKDGKVSLSNRLRKALKLSPLAIGLLYEAQLGAGESLSALSPEHLSQLINGVPLHLTGIAPLARAISTAGGIRFDEIDENFMLRRKPGTFVAGEMLDWDAPTGGYLLQACFATGVAAGTGALKWLRQRAPDQLWVRA